MSANFEYVANILPFAPELNLKATSKNWLSARSSKSFSESVAAPQTEFTLPFPVVCVEWLDIYLGGVGILNKQTTSQTGGYEYDTFNLDPTDNTKVIFTQPVMGDLEFVAQTNSFDANCLVVDMSSYFVQMNEVTPSNTFRGSTDCMLHILTAPAHGYIRVGIDRISFQYSPKQGFLGVDSFSYKITSHIGQESEPKCCFITVTP